MTKQVNDAQAKTFHLRPVMTGDLQALFEFQREPEANAMAAFPARDRDAFMVHWTRILGDKTVVAMAAVIDEHVVGNIGCWSQDGQRLIGYWIGKAYWGKGIATKMLSAFVGLVTERPLHAHVAKHNIASMRVLEKCGFSLCEKTTMVLGESADGVEELVYVLLPSSVGDG